MNIICINNIVDSDSDKDIYLHESSYDDYMTTLDGNVCGLTLNKSYVVVSESRNCYEIRNNDNMARNHRKSRFETIDKYREDKINEILG